MPATCGAGLSKTGSTDGDHEIHPKGLRIEGKRCRVNAVALCSGPGGRRFKSSLPDQSFQALKSYFWFFRHTAVDDFVDGSVFLFFQLKFNSIDSRTIECESAKNYNQNAR